MSVLLHSDTYSSPSSSVLCESPIVQVSAWRQLIDVPRLVKSIMHKTWKDLWHICEFSEKLERTRVYYEVIMRNTISWVTFQGGLFIWGWKPTYWEMWKIQDPHPVYWAEVKALILASWFMRSYLVFGENQEGWGFLGSLRLRLGSWRSSEAIMKWSLKKARSRESPWEERKKWGFRERMKLLSVSFFPHACAWLLMHIGFTG